MAKTRGGVLYYLEQKLVVVLLFRLEVKRQQGHVDRDLALRSDLSMMWPDFVPLIWQCLVLSKEVRKVPSKIITCVGKLS